MTTQQILYAIDIELEPIMATILDMRAGIKHIQDGLLSINTTMDRMEDTFTSIENKTAIF